MNEHEARAEICRVGQSLFERGYVHGTAGNISVRLPDGAGYLITPTDACLGFLDAARLARLDEKLQQVGGDRASKSMALHAEIYAAASRYDPTTSCVIHTHSTHCVALTLRSHEDELLAPITPYFVMKVGHVPVVPYDRPGAPDVAKQVGATIRRYGDAGTPIRAVMLSRLGPNVWHSSPTSAMAVLEELEETARLVCIGGAFEEPLSESQIEELRRAFGARW
jgi:ribulose-5-phosphate 4-epimerase/fuculose-1-phosphate aldolase